MYNGGAITIASDQQNGAYGVYGRGAMHIPAIPIAEGGTGLMGIYNVTSPDTTFIIDGNYSNSIYSTLHYLDGGDSASVYLFERIFDCNGA